MSIKAAVRSLLRRATASDLVTMPLWGLARRHALPRWVWTRLPAERTFLLSPPVGQPFLYASIANDVIGRALFWRGLEVWEAETIRVFCRLAQHSDLILDIGANTGVYALLACAANSQARVLCFEPVPRTYRKLVEHIKLNGWEDRCQAYPQAVSNRVGTAKLHVPFEDLPTSASLNVQGFRGFKGTLIDVPTTTVDVVCPQDMRVDLVKIDVEWVEDQVLQGMERVLSTSAPSIIIECTPDGPWRTVEAILTKFGYSFYQLRREGPVAVEHMDPGADDTYRNFLCLAHSHLGRLACAESSISSAR